VESCTQPSPNDSLAPGALEHRSASWHAKPLRNREVRDHLSDGRFGVRLTSGLSSRDVKPAPSSDLMGHIIGSALQRVTGRDLRSRATSYRDDAAFTQHP
jgi:hypothetical protein